jgi:hypothetical protein
LGALQRIVARPWRWFFDACELDRDTAASIRAAGFRDVTTAERTVLTPFLPVNSLAYGRRREVTSQ